MMQLLLCFFVHVLGELNFKPHVEILLAIEKISNKLLKHAICHSLVIDFLKVVFHIDSFVR